jgi:solute:Na+ symporter, SSS family
MRECSRSFGQKTWLADSPNHRSPGVLRKNGLLIKLGALDIAIIAAYFLAVLAIGFKLKSKMETSSDFLLSRKSFSHWITGIAFMSANLGALEVLGHTANGAKYGMRTNHWYWIGAVPSMMFLGLFMVRYYYSNGVRSVPEYLRLRYDERAHLLNAASFAIVTVLMAGIDMFAFALIFKEMVGWSFTESVLLATAVVLLFVFWGGLSSSIYNEFLQFFLIVIGFLPLTFLGLRHVGGWHNLIAQLPAGYTHTWKAMGEASDPLGTPWWVIVVGLGLCSSPAYWCTDFLLVQRALAAKNLASARKTPLVAAVPKMLFPIIVTVQGMIAVAIAPEIVKHNYNLALPVMMSRFYGTGMLGLGITALLASFMSGMAGNITAFNTVVTYDLYQTYIKKNMPDRHYLLMARAATILGTVVACASSYLVLSFNNLMDYMQLIGILFISPFFVAFLVGMLWKRPSALAGFLSMVGGLSGAILEYVLYRAHIITFASPMAANVYMAVWGLVAGILVIIPVALLTKPADPVRLAGLIYERGHMAEELGDEPWYSRPAFYGIVVFSVFIALNWIFF